MTDTFFYFCRKHQHGPPCVICWNEMRSRVAELEAELAIQRERGTAFREMDKADLKLIEQLKVELEKERRYNYEMRNELNHLRMAKNSMEADGDG